MIVEDTIAIAFFAERSLTASFAAVEFANLLHWATEECCNFRQFLFSDPNVTGIARAALSATRTFECQSILIPGLVIALLLLIHDSP
jgi:hypothetical protein